MNNHVSKPRRTTTLCDPKKKNPSMALPTTTTISNKTNSPKCHVAVFPFPFSSHPMPMLNLVLKLAAEISSVDDVRFSFFNTAKSNAALFNQPKYQSLPSNVKPYDLDHDGVPAGHVSSGHHLEAVDLFLRTTPGCYESAVDRAISETGTNITCLVTDAFLTSSGGFARDYLNGVPWIALFTPFPCYLSAHLHAGLIRDHSKSDKDKDKALDFVPGLSDMRLKDLPENVIFEDENDPLLIKTLRKIGTVLPKECTALALKFYPELGPGGLERDLESKFRTVLNIGFLTTFEEPDTKPDESGVVGWLDGQLGEGPAVAYVSFGTLAEMERDEVVSLAEALEESGVGFVWSIRGRSAAYLPDGFEKRTTGRGRVVAWAPQLRVLRHPAVGVFLTHCGSNSVYESIVSQVPMICRPFFGDQLLLARMVDKVWKVGVKLNGDMFNKNELLKSLKLVLGKEEQAKLMRERVSNLKQTIFEAASPDGSAAKDFKTLVELVTST